MLILSWKIALVPSGLSLTFVKGVRLNTNKIKLER